MKNKKKNCNVLPTQVSRKDFNKFIDPYLSHGKRGPKPTISRYKIFNYILKVLHTGIQWSKLETYRNEIFWSSIYRHHNRWSKDGSYVNLFASSVEWLNDNDMLDLSILHGDGSNTVAKKGANKSGIRDISIKKVKK